MMITHLPILMLDNFLLTDMMPAHLSTALAMFLYHLLAEKRDTASVCTGAAVYSFMVQPGAGGSKA